MKKLKKLIPIILIVVMLFSGCSSAASSTGTAEEASAVPAVALSAVVSSTSAIVVDSEFTTKDLTVDYDDSTATHVTLNGTSIQVTGDGAAASDGTLTISAAGTYVVTGELSDGQIIVDVGDEDKVRIILNGVTINCSHSAPIYVKNADKVFITLNENTENTLTDGSEYVQTDDNTVDGVIFSKADLTINGEGNLNITANYKHAIVSKNDLVITGGTYNITAVSDGLSGKDCVKIKDGSFNITTSDGQGITSKNDEDTTKGYAYIAGGTITINDCYEGIEGTAIVVEGGTIDITAQDDGFNSASASTTESSTGDAMGPGGGAMGNDENCYLSIAGGTITVNAQGDGLDSNGNVYISGGTVTVCGPTNGGNGAMDYNGIADVSGGTVVIVGSTGMAQGFSDTSTQYSLLYNLTSVCAAGTEVTLTDADGNEIVSYTPDKEYQSVVISTSDLEEGATYTLTCGDQTADIQLTSVVTSNGSTGMGMGGDRPSKGEMGGPGQGNMPQPE